MAWALRRRDRRPGPQRGWAYARQRRLRLASVGVGSHRPHAGWTMAYGSTDVGTIALYLGGVSWRRCYRRLHGAVAVSGRSGRNPFPAPRVAATRRSAPAGTNRAIDRRTGL